MFLLSKVSENARAELFENRSLGLDLEAMPLSVKTAVLIRT